MKLIVDKKNHRNICQKIKRKKIRDLSIEVRKDFFSSLKTILSLKRIADFCIENDINLQINNIPMCFMLGYKKYLVFDKNKMFIKLNQCGSCQFSKECPGILKGYSVILKNKIKPILRGFTDLERCMLKILNIENGISTERVLKMTKGIKICASCTSEGEVFRVADRLIDKKLIKREFKNGSYVWFLV